MVEPFDIAISFNHLVCYGLSYLVVESLHICHSVIYTAGGDEVTHISLRVIYRMHTQIVDV